MSDDDAPVGSVNYTRPVPATLHVHLDNGETFPATAADLRRFDLVTTLDAYMRVDDAVTGVLHRAGALPVDRDLTWAELNSVRYLIELAIRTPDLVEAHDHDGWSCVADLERALIPVDVSALPCGPWSAVDPRDPAEDWHLVDGDGNRVDLSASAVLRGIAAVVTAAHVNAARSAMHTRS